MEHEKAKEMSNIATLHDLYTRWPALKAVDSRKLLETYYEFMQSDEFGNDDELFLIWIRERFGITLLPTIHNGSIDG